MWDECHNPPYRAQVFMLGVILCVHYEAIKIRSIFCSVFFGLWNKKDAAVACYPCVRAPIYIQTTYTTTSHHTRFHKYHAQNMCAPSHRNKLLPQYIHGAYEATKRNVCCCCCVSVSLATHTHKHSHTFETYVGIYICICITFARDQKNADDAMNGKFSSAKVLLSVFVVGIVVVFFEHMNTLCKVMCAGMVWYTKYIYTKRLAAM